MDFGTGMTLKSKCLNAIIIFLTGFLLGTCHNVENGISHKDNPVVYENWISTSESLRFAHLSIDSSAVLRGDSVHLSGVIRDRVIKIAKYSLDTLLSGIEIPRKSKEFDFSDFSTSQLLITPVDKYSIAIDMLDSSYVYEIFYQFKFKGQPWSQSSVHYSPVIGPYLYKFHGASYAYKLSDFHVRNGSMRVNDYSAIVDSTIKMIEKKRRSK